MARVLPIHLRRKIHRSTNGMVVQLVSFHEIDRIDEKKISSIWQT